MGAAHPVERHAMERSRDRIETGMRRLFMGIALASVTILFLILAFLVWEGIPIFKTVSVGDFLSGIYWYPTDEPADFGVLPLIAGSIAVSLLSAVVSIPLGVMTAIYLAEIARPRIKEWVKPLVELLAALPSVVIGFFGLVVVGPFLQKVFDIPVGLNLLNASLMLAFMSIPTICSISEDAIHSVPASFREASLALGATRLETIIRVVLPASMSGVSTGVILGMSRAIGETMVVLMVAGGAAIVPGSIFDPVRPMPASIAAEMAEAPFRGEHYHALFAIGIVLFCMTLAFNLLADHVAGRFRKVAEGRS